MIKHALLVDETDYLQEVMGNIGKAVFDENQNILENWDEASFLGS